MLDLFKKPPRTHSLSESGLQCRATPSNSSSALPGRQQNDSPYASILGSPEAKLSSSDQEVPAQPKLTHQRPASDLPPLPIEESDLGSAVVSVAQGRYPKYFPCSSEHFPQTSPPKPKRLSKLSLTGEKTERAKDNSQHRILSGWFNGESEPISIGILPSPIKEQVDPLSTMTSNPTQTAPKPMLSSRFSFFTSKSSTVKTSPAATDPADEFLDLDIKTALFPSGPVDSFSPASFKNHMQHAEGLLSKLQAAYKERTTSLREIQAEKEAQVEEREGAEMRSKHLKIQLDDMSAKLAEQDNAMMDLVEQLANEKRLRREEEEARKRSVKLVKPSGIGAMTPIRPDASVGHNSQCKRVSSASTTDCDSEDESSAESLFSRQRSSSPRMSLSSVSTTSSPEAYQSPDFSGIATAQIARLRHGQPMLVKSQRQSSVGAESITLSCANCQGGNPSEAWTIVGVLKEENKCLKDQVEHMEQALEGCLDVVNRLS